MCEDTQKCPHHETFAPHFARAASMRAQNHGGNLPGVALGCAKLHPRLMLQGRPYGAEICLIARHKTTHQCITTLSHSSTAIAPPARHKPRRGDVTTLTGGEASPTASKAPGWRAKPPAHPQHTQVGRIAVAHYTPRAHRPTSHHSKHTRKIAHTPHCAEPTRR